jgi:uncharacterized protein DUF4116
MEPTSNSYWINGKSVPSLEFQNFSKFLTEVTEKETQPYIKDNNFSREELSGLFDLDGDKYFYLKDFKSGAAPLSRSNKLLSQTVQILKKYGFDLFSETSDAKASDSYLYNSGIPKQLWTNRDFVLFASGYSILPDKGVIPTNPLLYAAREFLNDKEIVGKAIRNDCRSMNYVGPKLKGDDAIEKIYNQHCREPIFDSEYGKLNFSLGMGFHNSNTPGLAIGGEAEWGGHFSGYLNSLGLNFFVYHIHTPEKTNQPDDHLLLFGAAPQIGLVNTYTKRSDYALLLEAGLPLASGVFQGDFQLVTGASLSMYATLNGSPFLGVKGQWFTTPFSEEKNHIFLFTAEVSPGCIVLFPMCLGQWSD